MTDVAVRTLIAVHVAVIAAGLAGLAAAGLTPEELYRSTWFLPFVSVNLGILLGNLAMAWLSKQPDTSNLLALEGRREDLEHSRHIVVEQLRALEAERDKLTAEDYARERAALLAVGTEASRALDEGPETMGPPTEVPLAAAWANLGPPTAVGPGGNVSQPPFLGASPVEGAPSAGVPTSPATTPPTMGPVDALTMKLRLEREADPAAFDAALGRLGVRTGGMSGEWRGALYTLAGVALLAVLYLFAAGDAKDRAPGMGMTGGDGVAPPSMRGEAPAGAQGAGPAAQPAGVSPEMQARFDELDARLAANPDDLEALNGITEMAIASQDLRRALESNTRAMELSPGDPDARTFRAVLSYSIGRKDEALQMLDGILEQHPQAARALVYRGLLTLRTDPAKAVEVLERAVAIEDSPAVRGLLEEARAMLAGGGAPPAAIPDAAPPAAAAPPEGAPVEVLVAGTIQLGKAGATGQRVFVSLRNPAMPGPPLAAVQLAPGPFPMPFTITSNELLAMGGMRRPTPDTFQIVARLDSDGDPITRPDTDPSATAPSVARGVTDLVLTLE